MIPYAKQDINQADIDSVVDVLHSDFLTQGPQVPLFEKTVASYCNAKYAVASNSAILSSIFVVSIGQEPAKATEGKNRIIKVKEYINFFMLSFISD